SHSAEVTKFYYDTTPIVLFDTAEQACRAYAGNLTYLGHSSGYSGTCRYNNKKPPTSVTTNTGYFKSKSVTVPDCFNPDYKIVSQPISSLKKTICLPMHGGLCRYTGDPTNKPIVNGGITTTFS